MANITVNALLERLDQHCFDRLQAAVALCATSRHPEVIIEHLLLRLLETDKADLALMLGRAGFDTAPLRAALQKVLAEQPRGHAGRPVMSSGLLDLLQAAWLSTTLELDQNAIRSGALLLAVLDLARAGQGAPWLRVLQALDRDALLAGFRDTTRDSLEEGQGRPGAPEAASTGSSEREPALRLYCYDISERAKSGRMDPVFGRDRETRQIIDILARRRKNNPIIVGDAGVGKTAVVEGLALRIAAGDVPTLLREVSILGLDLGLLEAGAGVKGEFESRLKSVIQEIKEAPHPIILFIDEAHVLIGAGGRAGGNDAANLLKPALARGDLRTIAATTWSEYKKFFERDQALSRRFQPVKLDEPSVDTTLDILRGLKPRYEADHGVSIRDDALVAAAELSSRYITGRLLPDKAVDLLDTRAARVKVSLTHVPPSIEERERRMQGIKRKIDALQRDRQSGLNVDEQALDEAWEQLETLRAETARLRGRLDQERALVNAILDLRRAILQKGSCEGPGDSAGRQERLRGLLDQLKTVQADEPLLTYEMDPDAVAKVISDWTGIPLGKVLRDEALSVLQLKQTMGQRIRGQEPALDIISRAIRSAKSGLNDPRLPLGVFLLVGPSGVGKTETALCLADALFGDERALISINMSEFQERHSLSRLIGSPPGYAGYGEGGLLTEAVRRRPYSVVLLDEAEKANIEVMNLFYQVFDKGILADGEGRLVDFKHTIVFLTSNLASDFIAGLRGSQPMTIDAIIRAVRPILSDHFKPALLARMTIAPFFPLGREALRDIIELKLERLSERMRERNHVRLAYTQRVVDRILARCTDAETGARNIDHVLGQTILPRLSEELLHRTHHGDPPRSAELDLDSNDEFTITMQ